MQRSLIAKAHNRQIVRYDDVAQMMGYPDNRPLSGILNYIMVYCSQHALPPLTIIVVNKDGTPGPGFTETSRHEFDRKREEVFACDWYDIVPPTIEEFNEAYILSKNPFPHASPA
jgi:alkylated DNA nucleotide flippase Atl1